MGRSEVVGEDPGGGMGLRPLHALTPLVLVARR